MADDPKPTGGSQFGSKPGDAAKSEGGEPQRRQLQVDESQIQTGYTNFCRVMRTPEEVVLDFGLNTDPAGQAGSTVKLTQRIVCNYYTAKRLLGALNFAVAQHERLFGVMEVDVNKRVQARQQQGGAGSGAAPGTTGSAS